MAPDWLPDVVVLLALTGTPITLKLAWWFGLRRFWRTPFPSWRRRLLLAGLAAASCNVLLYAGYLVYWRKYMYVPDFWRVRDACGNRRLGSGTVGFDRGARRQGARARPAFRQLHSGYDALDPVRHLVSRSLWIGPLWKICACPMAHVADRLSSMQS